MTTAETDHGALICNPRLPFLPSPPQQHQSTQTLASPNLPFNKQRPWSAASTCLWSRGRIGDSVASVASVASWIAETLANGPLPGLFGDNAARLMFHPMAFAASGVLVTRAMPHAACSHATRLVLAYRRVKRPASSFFYSLMYKPTPSPSFPNGFVHTWPISV